LAFAPANAAPSETGGVTALRVLPAAEYSYFDKASRETFWNVNWKITPQSSRAGYRLDGPTLDLAEPIEMRSHGIVPGVIQVPSGGVPIIQLADSQTAGGYPKIGTIIEADLWRLGQAKLGASLRFVETTYLEALEAADSVHAYLDKVRNLADAYRTFGGSLPPRSDPAQPAASVTEHEGANRWTSGS
jgi:allophanate hydrolase subunit 2